MYTTSETSAYNLSLTIIDTNQIAQYEFFNVIPSVFILDVLII